MFSLVEHYTPDLFFCHGDWLHDYQIPLSHGIPYVLFEHDIHSLRADLNPKQLRLEKEMLENAAGVIFTSEDHRAYCDKHFNITRNRGLIHLRPLRRDLAWEPRRKLPGKNLVYAGGLVAQTGSNYGYRSYHKIFKDFMAAGWHVHIYPANHYAEETIQSYKNLGCTVHPKCAYNTLLRRMSQYTAGLQAYAKEGVPDRAFEYTQTCRPNKVWDYLAAGIPTIGLYPGNCARIYVDGGWGVTIPNTNRSTLDKVKLPSFPPGLRYEQTMERDLPVMEVVVAKALSRRPTVTKEQIQVDVKGEDDEMAKVDHLWYRLTKPVVEKGKLLHGRGKRIPMKEAIRLGLVKKETLVKETIKKRVEKKAAEKEKIEIKPLVDEAGQVPVIKEKKEEKPPKKKQHGGKKKKAKHHKKNKKAAGQLHTSLAVIKKEGDN